MSSILNASASGGLVSQGDASATLELQSDGTTKFTVSPTGAYGTLRLETAKAWNWNGSSTNTVLEFTGIPSWAKRITVMFAGLSTNGSSVLLIQIGSGSFTTTGYTSSTGYITTSSAARSTATAGFAQSTMSPVSTISGGSSINVLAAGSFSYVNSGVLDNQGGSTINTAGGVVTLSGVLDRIRITTVNGTDIIDAGTVNICIEG